MRTPVSNPSTMIYHDAPQYRRWLSSDALLPSLWRSRRDLTEITAQFGFAAALKKRIKAAGASAASDELLAASDEGLPCGVDATACAETDGYDHPTWTDPSDSEPWHCGTAV